MRRLTIVLPAIFFLALLAFTVGVLDQLLPEAAAVLVSFSVATVGIIVFSRAVFSVIDGLQDRLRSQNDDLEQRTEHLRAVHEAGISITSDLSLAAVLQKVVDTSRDVVGARYGALGVLGEDGSISEFITSGISDERRAAIGDIPHGHGLLGLVLREGVPYRSKNIPSDEHAFGFPANHPPMTTFLGVPVVYKGSVIGDLYLTDKLTGEFTPEDEDAIGAFAVQAAIAIENARLYERVQGIAVLEERDRIGMDLHDGTIQSIYGVGLKLEDCIERLEQEPEAVRKELDEAIEKLNAIIRDIRNYIFDLRPLRLQGCDLLSALQALMRETEINTLMTADVMVDDADDPCDLLTEEQASQLYHIAHEALANARKHAGARSVTAELFRRDGRFVMRIADDGKGFDTESREKHVGNGMINMTDRTRALGGEIKIESAAGVGTKLTVELPVASEEAI